MRPSELLALVYFAAFLAAAWLCRTRRQEWRRTAMLAAAGVVLVLAGVLLPDARPPGLTVRDWWPLLALPIAYWTPAPLAGRPVLALECWLAKVDMRWPALTGLRHPRWMHALDPLLELSYLFVYPMVPAGLLAVGWEGNRAVTDAFWPALLLAVLPCYALLAVMPTRTPRALAEGREPVEVGIRVLNIQFLEIFSNRWNTFPSGHAAGAATVAVLVARAGSPLAVPFALLALGIALGTVRGRYHYLVDTVAGVAVGLLTGVLT